jgi:hypothetical protein
MIILYFLVKNLTYTRHLESMDDWLSEWYSYYELFWIKNKYGQVKTKREDIQCLSSQSWVGVMKGSE